MWVFRARRGTRCGIFKSMPMRSRLVLSKTCSMTTFALVFASAVSLTEPTRADAHSATAPAPALAPATTAGVATPVSPPWAESRQLVSVCFVATWPTIYAAIVMST